MNEVGLLILAAGASRRMGQIKALLPWGNKTLLSHQLETALSVGKNLVLVLGAHAPTIQKTLKNQSLYTVVNPKWEEGMGTSLAFGTRAILQKFPAIKGLLVLTTDQPLVSQLHLNNMLAAFQPHNKQIIVSSSADGWQGVPVLFDAFYFEALQQLTGDFGAKKLTQQFKDHLMAIPAGDQLVDVDTPESYAALQRKINPQS